MPPATRFAFDASPLRQRLAALRRRLYLVATVRGVGWLLTVLVATAVVAGVLDWRWHLPGLVRAVFLVIALAGAAIIAVRYLARPLSQKADDLALALRVEERYPALNDALASTVQFLNQTPEKQHDSASMRREAVRRALGAMYGLDFNRVVDSRGLFSASLAMTAACAVGFLLLWIDPVLAKTALVRLTNPFGNRDWPHLTQIDGLEARYKSTSTPAFTVWLPLTSRGEGRGARGEMSPFRVGKNYEYQIQGVVKGRVVPEKVAVVFRSDNFPPSEHSCEVMLDETTMMHRFSTRLKPDQVQRTFHFSVVANDDRTEEFTVEVLPPPMLVPLDGLPSPQLKLHYPSYTGLPSPHSLPPGTGNIEAVAGTGVTLRAKADRPLRAAWIEYLPDNAAITHGALLAPLGAAHPLGCAALTAGGQAVWQRVPARLDSDMSQFTIEFLPCVHGNYILHFEDDTGLRNSRTFELRLRSDPAPVVQLERPSAARDILLVLPDADLPLHVLADDHIFALRSVSLRYRTVRAEAPRTIWLYDHATVVPSSVAPMTGPAVLAAKDLKLRPTNLEFRRTLSLKTIQHSNGWALRDGDVVILQAAADDFDDVALSKQPGLSHEVEIRIVGRNALENELNRQQAKVQQDLLRLREREREALKNVTEVENKLKRGEKLREEDLEKLRQAEQDQQQIHERVGTPNEGLRSEVARLLQTLRQNHLENSAVKERMQDVLRQLDRIADNELDPIEQRLSQARKQAELNDDKSQADNKAALEKQAREQLDRANAAAKDAAQKLARAIADEALADGKPSGDAERERLEAEAKQLKQEAVELQKKAEQLKRQAEQARKDADSGAASQTRGQLDEARLHQEEVEKTLTDLLARLEPWSSTREIKGEANKLLEEQRQLLAELEKLKEREKDLLGKSFNQLTQRQAEELAQMRDEQQRIEERTNQLLTKMDRMSQDRADKDPETAKELQDASQQASKDNIPGQMREAKDNVKNNRIQDAQNNQRNAVEGLQRMVKTLEDRREAELDRLVKKLREAEKQLDELTQEQEQLQKKVQAANNLADLKQREDELKKLAKQQKDLQDKTQEMMKQLSRLRVERASSELGKAGGEMEQAGSDLTRGQKADDRQEDALNRLDDAANELEKARQQAEEQLRREQLARVEETLKRLRDRQEALNAEATRVQKAIQQKADWPRSLLSELSRLAENEMGLGTETAGVAKKELTGTPVFAKLVQKAAESMEKAGQRVVALKSEQPAFDILPDEELKRLQQDALHRLDQLLDAVKAEEAALRNSAAASTPAGGGSGGDGGGAGSRDPDEGLPPLAQLKLLRAMQEDVNKRTETFKKEHPDLDKLADKEKTELSAINRDQQEIAGLLEELRNANDPGGPGGDK